MNYPKLAEFGVALLGKSAIPLMLNMIEIWAMSASLLVLVWFQPVLLQLRPMRGVGWISAITVAPAVFALCHPGGIDGLTDFFGYILFLSVALTWLFLIDQRTRPWMSVVAGAACSGTLTLLQGVVPPAMAIGFANVALGAVLLYGTQRIEWKKLNARLER
jgi:hypothetical protein